MRSILKGVFALAIGFGVSGCSLPEMSLPDFSSPDSQPQEPDAPTTLKPGEEINLGLQPMAYQQVPGWKEDDLAPALDAFIRSCARMERQNLEQPMGGATAPTLGGRAGRIVDWLPVCAAAKGAKGQTPALVRYFFESWFRPHLVTNNGNPQGLFTGYYEAELRGHWNPSDRYRYPIYARPRDLISVSLGQFDDDFRGKAVHGMVKGSRLVPYADREAIDKGYLKNRALELLFVDDAVDAFFLHIQGSGRVLMEDGTTVSLGYAGKNGRPYTSIGKKLIDMGALKREDVTMPSIRDWLLSNEDKANKVLWENQSYVFFEQKEAGDPLGAEGIPLTPGRSLAVDRSLIPFGVPVWVDTTDPLVTALPFQRLMVAQDTGGAILGPIRGDIFFGYGKDAADQAGSMKQAGQYYILLPKELSPTSTGSR